MGLNTSTAINLFVKAVLRENRIPFELTPAAPDPFFLEANLAYVKKSVSELRAGKGTAHELIEEDELRTKSGLTISMALGKHLVKG